LFDPGELVLAYEHLEQGIALYDPQQDSSHTFLYGQDPGLMCLAHLAVTLWWLSYPDQARQRSHELLTLIQDWLYLLAQAHGKAGQVEAGLHALDEALEAVH
jgi:predicted ATPase